MKNFLIGLAIPLGLAVVVLVAIYVVAVIRYNTAPPVTQSSSTPPPPEPEPVKPSKYDVGPPTEQEMLELVNQERKKVGVTPLRLDSNVSKSAQLKADDFANRNYYDHKIKGTDKVLTPEWIVYL